LSQLIRAHYHGAVETKKEATALVASYFAWVSLLTHRVGMNICRIAEKAAVRLEFQSSEWPKYSLGTHERVHFMTTGDVRFGSKPAVQQGRL
jgi:hypothetical protein